MLPLSRSVVVIAISEISGKLLCRHRVKFHTLIVSELSQERNANSLNLAAA